MWRVTCVLPLALCVHTPPTRWLRCDFCTSRLREWSARRTHIVSHWLNAIWKIVKANTADGWRFEAASCGTQSWMGEMGDSCRTQSGLIALHKFDFRRYIDVCTKPLFWLIDWFWVYHLFVIVLRKFKSTTKYIVEEQWTFHWKLPFFYLFCFDAANHQIISWSLTPPQIEWTGLKTFSI